MFSMGNYRTLLGEVKKRGYEVMPLSRFTGNMGGAIILLRYDVDYSHAMAMRIAEVNASLGISGTFFFLMDSIFYNLCSSESQKTLAQLKELKQEIGWHVPFEYEKTTKEFLTKQWHLFKTIVPHAVPLVAWHNPQNNLIDAANAIAESTGILRPVYGKSFISETVKYLSDSNRRNGFHDLMEKLHPDTLPGVQLLLHPFNWVIGGDNMRVILRGAWNAIMDDIDKEFSVNPNWKNVERQK